ncbi:hypothetical protein [Salisaeta icosahedral phage 1]|uniref:phosphoadenosine phosphosulfate reductase n=1 Tax=Salisaeta icosahedral phage 1 TaxID=1183239 RepID=UPI00025EA926|nr:phosphoadenosine phosphosulfate reductase [Salisaeta icosahedral phage 1]AFJ21480.1 hypothetical protein [Salisaeta icosahedral phage 1]
MSASDPLQAISLGAGVQSTVMYLMACEGLIEPTPDVAIFADTGFEPRAVYEHLEYLSDLDASIPIEIVSNGNIRDDTLASIDSDERWAAMPLHVYNEKGETAMLRRQCTREYKIQPIERHIRKMMGLKKGQHVKRQVIQWIGITTDEIQRLKEARKKWLTFRYPLCLEMKMSRADCISWLNKKGYPTPPKSSCICCPFHSDNFWRWLKQKHPEDFRSACQFDEAIREGLKGVDSTEAYLHRSMTPLSEIDFSDPQYSIDFPSRPEETDPNSMVNDCFGMCGV